MKVIYVVSIILNVGDFRVRKYIYEDLPCGWTADDL